MSWWNSDECQAKLFEMDARRGGQWRFGTQQGNLNVNGVSQFSCQGEVLEFDPPLVLAHTWIANWLERREMWGTRMSRQSAEALRWGWLALRATPRPQDDGLAFDSRSGTRFAFCCWNGLGVG
jgi:uncharacterized protein YndB with AHSA1/START domain